jgi:hypothetical protein
LRGGSERDAVRLCYCTGLADRLVEPRSPLAVAAELPDGAAGCRRGSGERCDARELVPENALLVLADADVQPGAPQELRRVLDVGSRERLGRDRG